MLNRLSNSCFIEIYKRLVTVSTDSEQMICMRGCGPQVVIVGDRVAVGMSKFQNEKKNIIELHWRIMLALNNQ